MGYREDLRAHYAAVRERLSRGQAKVPVKPKPRQVKIVRREYMGKPAPLPEAVSAPSPARASAYMRVPSLRDLEERS